MAILRALWMRHRILTGTAPTVYMSRGKNIGDQRLYAQAEEKLTSSVQLDSNFIPSLTKLAALMYVNMRYDDALTLAKGH